jgi:hypothetical protein
MILTTEQIDDLKSIISKSIDNLFANDTHLIYRNRCERSISFHLGCYLYKEMKESSWLMDYHIDSEYNKNINDIKKIKDANIIPDLIIHKRGSNNENIAVIEIKHSYLRLHPAPTPRQINNAQNITTADINKLKKLTSQTSAYKYGIGVSINIFQDISNTNSNIKYFIDAIEQS